ncbi:YjbF family lipoprotein [Tabrizicola sp.]|uniref:YjbF family lipoprotein n=1 Tax=Tabrizicola sp. TaxID=2005166 RepID=UPI003F2DDAD7
MTFPVRLCAALVALSLLAACGNDGSGPNPVVAAVGGMAKASVAKLNPKKSGTAAAPAPTTRADLEKFGMPILRVTSKPLGQDGFLTISDAKDDVVTWATSDGVTFSLRNGVLIQTRGLGADLMSADVPSVAQLKTAGGTHQRVYFFLGDDDRGTRRTYDCTTSVVGRETIEIVGRSHKVTHVSEVCARGNTQITNEYWIEGASIRKSRQWVSGQISYVEFQRVID